MPHVVLTVTLGDIVTITSFVGGVILIIFRFHRVEWKVQYLWAWFCKKHNINGESLPKKDYDFSAQKLERDFQSRNDS